jgi:hypothetical protein
MPTPATALIDDFIGPDVDPLPAPWNVPFGMSIVSNMATNDPSSGGQAIWPTLFTANQEVWVDVVTPFTLSGIFLLYVCTQDPTSLSGVTGYSLAWNTGGIGLRREDPNLGSVSLGSAAAPAAGARVGLTRLGASITLWKIQGGVFSTLVSATDNVIRREGYIAMYAAASTGDFVNLSNFGGGSLDVASPRFKRRTHRSVSWS